MPTRLLAAALACAAWFVSLPALAQAAKAELSTPPADAQKFVIISSGGRHGTVWRWREADGTDVVRENILLRGRTWDQEMRVHAGANGQPDRIEIRGTTPNGDSAETFTVADGQAQWKTPLDGGRVPYDGRSQYLPFGGTWAQPYTTELIHRAPQREVPLLPAGKARMSRLVDVPVGSGATAKTVTAWAIEGIDLEPSLVLLDADGRFFGWAQTMALLPEAYVDDHLKLQQAQIEALAAREPAIARRFMKLADTPVAFTNVRLFDADATRFVEDQTVVVDGSRIVAVGPANATPVPAGARVIDGRGHTLTPGLWDAHMHAGTDRQGAMLLSIGETSARDPGSNTQRVLLRRERFARGELLYPTIHSSLLIDGRGPNAAQIAQTAGSLDEALALVRLAREKGFIGVKLYGSLDPRWVPQIVGEARRLGLHVHGHVPATLRPRDAIAAGYHELTHINFVMMQAMPDDVVGVSNTVARFQGPGRYAKDVNLEAEPMASFIREIAEKRIVIDPTLAVFERILASQVGDMSAAYGPFLGTLPPAIERGFREGGEQPPAGVTRADYRASYAKLLELTKRLHDAGAMIVAGTDGWGLELVRELELYVQAGLSPAQALRTATLNPAQLVGVADTNGSIAVGKRADLVLVEGDASRDIGVMRQTRWVVLGGALMNADELRAQAGFTGRPRAAVRP